MHGEAAMRIIEFGKTIGEWFDHRLQLAAPIREAAEHPVPRNTASWFYVFGSAALTVFILQLVTGILLALIYVPSAGEAWSSLQALNHQVALGWFIRAMHGWGSNFMVAIVLIHMVQVFLFGAHKFPRELTWVIGVFLLLMTLGMAFSGQVLRFDQDAYWGLGIGASIASRVPIIGPAAVKLMLGGPIIAGATLSRFFALHVFVIPGMLIAFVGLHVLMVLKLGINEWPMPGRIVKRDTYEREYHEMTKRAGAPFVPYAVWKDLFFAAFIILAVAACAFYFGPFGPTGQPDPTIIQTAPKPDYFFLWLYALLSLLPPSMETPFLLIVPPIAILALILLPFLSGEGEKSWKRRPIAVLTVLLIAITLGTFTRMAQFAPWSPKMNAWSGDPVPDRFVHGTTALERQGALVFQVKQCRNCHSLGETGGKRGPSLDGVAVRLTQDQLIRQVIQGGGNMPAYGNNLSPAETTAIVAFLETLHPAGQVPARDSSREVVLGDSDHKEAVAQR
jgi:ubiquinol-cytochrome c reductase cytochrome b subunit